MFCYDLMSIRPLSYAVFRKDYFLSKGKNYDRKSITYSEASGLDAGPV